MGSDTPQAKVEPRIAISVTRRETLYLLDLLGEHEELRALYKDMKQMAARRGWCARNSGGADAPDYGSAERDASRNL